MKNFLRILLKALVPNAYLPFSREKIKVFPAGESEMTSNTACLNQRPGTFSQRINSTLPSLPEQPETKPASENEEPSNSFIAVLLRCLSAFNS